jgi:hypothetical protein
MDFLHVIQPFDRDLYFFRFARKLQNLLDCPGQSDDGFLGMDSP